MRNSKQKVLMLNAAILLALVFYVMMFTLYIKQESMQTEIENITESVDSLRRRSTVYLDASSQTIRDWAARVRCHDWNVDEVLRELSEGNSDDRVDIQLLDPENLQGTSAYGRESEPASRKVQYKTYYDLSIELEALLEEGAHDSIVTSAFTNDRNGVQSIAFASLVPVRQEGGTIQQMYLLRVEPMAVMQQYWDMEDRFSGTQVSLVNANGAYLFRAPMLKNTNFYEFLRSYNDLTYPEIDAIQAEIRETDEAGWMVLKNAQGHDTLYIYSTKTYNDWFFVGALEVKELKHSSVQWQLLVVLILGFSVLTIVDVAYYTSMNRRLRESLVDLENANAAKTRFLSSMSHDIRTPMNAIIGMTTLAQKNVNDPQKVDECLRKVSLTSGHLLTLINDILDISKIESGKFNLSPRPFSLSEEIENLINIVNPTAQAKNLNFTFKVDGIERDSLYGDKLRLNQIWINILSNAVKYTPNGGTVTASLRQKVLPGEPEKVKLVYQVSDNGIGMSEEFQKTMFEPFTREKDGRVDKIEGSGLGMAITKQMVDLMNGTIMVQSKQGVGSTFTVTLVLPCAAEKVEPKLPAAGAESAPPKQDLTGVRLLVAEDNDLNWEVLSEMLQLYGVEADRAENGQICIEKLCAAPADQYAMIFMDIQMPVLNGYQTTRAIRRLDDPARAGIPIVAMTADAFAEDVAACLEAGMNGHVPKPIDLNVVLSEIRKYTKKKGKTKA